MTDCYEWIDPFPPAPVDLPEPRIIHRACGGVLAVSPDSARLKIGVTAATEAEARRQFAASYARCLAILSEGEKAPA